MSADATVALLVIGDGRDDYLRRCIDSMHHLRGTIVERWMHDDTGDPAYRAELAARYPRWRHINAGPRQGGAGAIRYSWRHLRDHTAADYLFWVEQDFQFIRPINLAAMAGLLHDRPYLAQIVLRRQPYNAAEAAAGGVVEQHPDWYVDMIDERGREWLEQGAYFTTNPNLTRTTLLDLDWPGHVDGVYSESTFHQRLMREGTLEVPGDKVRYAYWGARSSGVWVEHIGQQRHREGTGY
jgi:hypothetical protein